MVYSFFDPEEAGRSLGTLMILDHIERAKRMGLRYVYLGYWVNGSDKMDYKKSFQPLEMLGSAGWTRMDRQR
jgi:arginine-tRNA-protein transferase